MMIEETCIVNKHVESETAQIERRVQQIWFYEGQYYCCGKRGHSM